MTTDPFDDAMRLFENGVIRTQADACFWVRFWSSMRPVIASRSPQASPNLPLCDAYAKEFVDLIAEWRHTPDPLKARLLTALDLWLLRLRLEWNIGGN